MEFKAIMIIAGILITVLGGLLAEVWKRRIRRGCEEKLRELEKKFGERGDGGVVLAIERLRVDIRDLVVTIWQVETVFFGLLVTLLVQLL